MEREAIPQEEKVDLFKLDEILGMHDHGKLAESFMKKAEIDLLNGDPDAIRLFDAATHLDPQNPEHFYRQGLALFEYGAEHKLQKILLQSCKWFKKATVVKGDYFKAWYSWGSALFTLGKICGQHPYFSQAKQKFEKAIHLSMNESSIMIADLYWDYALSWMEIAQHSGEALDLHLAIEAFQKASSAQENLPHEFWFDFGTANLKLAEQINETRLYTKAINCYKHALSISISSAKGWHLLGNAFHLLYHRSYDEDDFSQANEAYATAIQLMPQQADIWLDWARALCESGKKNEDTKRLRSAIEKCQRAYILNPEQPLLTAVWGESLSLLGALIEELELIDEGYNKLIKATETTPDLPELWYSLGVSLTAYAHYFTDADYYYQAIEKFQHGLSLNRTYDKLWHALGCTYATVSHIDGEIDSLEKACRFFARALQLRPSSTYHYTYAASLSKLGELTHDQNLLEKALFSFEIALYAQKNSLYLHPEWLFQYAVTLDLLGESQEEEASYLKAIEIFSHVLMIDPDFPGIHHRLGLCYAHLGELVSDAEQLRRAIHHYRIASNKDEEDDQITLDFAIALINMAKLQSDSQEAHLNYRNAEHKLIQAIRLGNLQAYYHLGCLYSLLGQFEQAMRFIEKGGQFDALPALEEMLEDEWLEGLMTTDAFRDYLTRMEKNS